MIRADSQDSSLVLLREIETMIKFSIPFPPTCKFSARHKWWSTPTQPTRCRTLRRTAADCWCLGARRWPEMHRTMMKSKRLNHKAQSKTFHDYFCLEENTEQHHYEATRYENDHLCKEKSEVIWNERKIFTFKIGAEKKEIQFLSWIFFCSPLFSVRKSSEEC